jgi:pimeloyl-ACP methyl ester carboxylesterase
VVYLSLTKIQCPTLLLVGEDSLHVVEAAREMSEQIDPACLTMKIFKNAGAPVYKDQPTKSFEVVNQFLKGFE